MKNATARLVGKLKNGSALKALPEVTVDWNLNRYHDTRADNQPAEQDAGFDIELFPIESITLLNRPRKGINKARVGHSTISREYFDVSNGVDGGLNARFYIADPDDDYKYWTSPKSAVGGVIPLFNTTNFPTSTSDPDIEEYPELTGHDNLTSARPFVEYGTWSENIDPDTGAVSNKNFTASTVRANKIVIRLENTWASPNDFDVVITRASSTTTLSDETITGWEASGEIVLYWNGFSWSSNADGPVADESTGFPLTDEISKVQLVVRTLKGGYNLDGTPTMRKNGETGNLTATNGSDSFLDVIEIGAHLEADLTRWVINVDDTFDMADASNLYPLGTVTSNQGNVSLSNIYQFEDGSWGQGLFAQENDDPRIPWTPYLEANAEVTLKYAFYENEDSAEPFEKVQQFVMYADNWQGQADESVTIPVSDFSKFFNEQMVPASMWENLKAPEIVWRVLDSVGFSDFQIDRGDRVAEHRISVFFTSGDQTVWEVLDELAKATQTAIYFDSYGVLQVKTRDYALSPLDGSVWTFQSNDTPDQKANIISLDQTNEFEPNSIKVIYQKTNWSAFNRGQPTMQKVWEPEDDTVVLRGTPLVRNLELKDTFLWIGADDVKVWPYEGLVQIQGEIIRYKGKQFVYYTGPNGGQRNTTTVTSDDEKQDVQRNKATKGYEYKSHFTGGLRIAKDGEGFLERGVWNTEVKRHPVDAEGYSVRHRVNGTRRTDVAGFRHLKQESKVQLNTGKRFKDYKDLLVATRGQADDQPFFHYGTKFRFVKEQGRTHQCAGIVIHNNGASEDGYYIEFTPSKRLGGKERKERDEMIVYSRVNGKDKRLGKRALAIGENIDYEVDVTYVNVPDSAAHRLQVWVNGKNCFNEKITGANRNAANGRFGLFARGKTKAQFEYLYAIRRQVPEPTDDFSFLDKVKRGYMGARWDREWVYQWKTYLRRVKKKSRRARKRLNRQFFDEFGPIVHEIREYDVKFEPTPVLHSRLYMTNDWSGVALDYSADPFGAKFAVANTARFNAVMHGDDTLSFAGTGQSVNQVMTVLGRPLVIEEAEEFLAENTDQIRARGKIESDLSSQWIQSKAMARDIAEWIRNNFTYGNDNINVEVFGNPLIQVGDVVRIEYPEKHLSGDYFVLGVKNAFTNGITTTLDLRRRI